MPKKRTFIKRASKHRGQNETGHPAGRAGRAFPGATFESVLPLAKAIWDHAGASREIRRETLFTDILKKAPESGPSRTLIRNSGRYGLTIGSEKSEAINSSRMPRKSSIQKRLVRCVLGQRRTLRYIQYLLSVCYTSGSREATCPLRLL